MTLALQILLKVSKFRFGQIMGHLGQVSQSLQSRHLARVPEPTSPMTKIVVSTWKSSLTKKGRTAKPEMKHRH